MKKKRLNILHIIPEQENMKFLNNLIYNYKIQFEKKGHIFDIRKDIKTNELYDVIHIHEMDEKYLDIKGDIVISIHNEETKTKKFSEEYNKELNLIKKSVATLTNTKSNIFYYDTSKIFLFEHGYKIQSGWFDIIDNLEQIYYNVKDVKLNLTSDMVRDRLIDIYENTNINHREINKPKINFLIDFKDSPKVVIKSPVDYNKLFNVDFVDKKNQQIIYSSTIKPNHWTMANRKWYTEWLINITDEHNNKVYNYEYDLRNKNVYIELKTDNIKHLESWVDDVNKFKNKHECLIHCYMNVNINENINHIMEKYDGLYFVDNMFDSNICYTRFYIGYTDDKSINPNGDTGINISKDVLSV